MKPSGRKPLNQNLADEERRCRGQKTTTGLRFERAVDFLTLLRRLPGDTTRRSAIAGTDVLFDGKCVAQCFIMKSLPDNQGSKGRHKCPYYAYNEGCKAGLKKDQKR